MASDVVVASVRALFKSEEQFIEVDTLKREVERQCKVEGTEALDAKVSDVVHRECEKWLNLLRTSPQLEQFLHFCEICKRFVHACDIFPAVFQSTTSFLSLVSEFQNILTDPNVINGLSATISMTVQAFLQGNTTSWEDLKTVLIVLKSLKAITPVNTKLTSEIHFEPDLSSRQRCFAHLAASFDYLERAKLIGAVLGCSTLEELVFQQTITNSMIFYTTGIEPVIGWILSKDHNLVMRLTETFKTFNKKAPNLWEPCCQFFYDNMFMNARSATDVERIITEIDDFSLHFAMCFENKRTAMTELEQRIRLFLNDPRINFPYFWAEFLKAKPDTDPKMIVRYTLRIDDMTSFMVHVDGAPESVLTWCRFAGGEAVACGRDVRCGRCGASKKSLDICRDKIKEVLAIKGATTSFCLVQDAFLLIKRKIRTDQPMILDATESLIQDGVVVMNEGLYTLTEL